jgi:tetratricopeptide (TPR) repeat protein
LTLFLRPPYLAAILRVSRADRFSGLLEPSLNFAVEKEIGHLRSLFWSARDPEGRAFAPLADAYRRAGDYKRALELLNDGLSRLPGFTPGHVVAARLYLEKGLLEEAELASRQALDLDDENTVALEALAGSLQALGRLQEATEVRERLEFLEGTGEVGEPPAEGDGSPETHTDAGEAEFARLVEDVVVEIATLAPEGVETEPVMDVGALAPEEAESEAVLDVEALAPEEAESDMVLDVEALAPEETTVDVDMMALEEALTEAVMDLEALAPEEATVEVVLEVEALAPDEAAVDANIMAPEEAATEPVLEAEALAPEEAQAVAEVDPLALEEAPTEALTDLEVLVPEEVEAPAPEEADAEGVVERTSAALDELPWDDIPDEPLVTRTMAELYAQQGLIDRALEILSELLRAAPDDRELQERVRQLGATSNVSRVPISEPASQEVEPEDHEWQSMPSDDAAGVDTPFAWTEEEVEGVSEGPGISTYFERVLSWRSHKMADASEGEEE